MQLAKKRAEDFADQLFVCVGGRKGSKRGRKANARVQGGRVHVKVVECATSTPAEALSRRTWPRNFDNVRRCNG